MAKSSHDLDRGSQLVDPYCDTWQNQLFSELYKIAKCLKQLEDILFKKILG